MIQKINIEIKYLSFNEVMFAMGKEIVYKDYDYTDSLKYFSNDMYKICFQIDESVVKKSRALIC